MVCSTISGLMTNRVVSSFSVLKRIHFTTGSGNVGNVINRQPLAIVIACRHMSMLDYFRKKKISEPNAGKEEEDIEQILLLEDNVQQFTEEEIAKKCNKSRLRPDHWRLVNGEVPHPDPVFWTHHTVRYKRRMFGSYGEKSGVNPGIIWPTMSQLKERIEYENICNPYTIQELIVKKRAIREAQRMEFEMREKEVDEKMKLVEKFKSELMEKQNAKDRETEAARLRREKLMEEVRRHFGYTVDPKDERFQEILLKKEKEQKKAEKEIRKLEKQKRALEKLDTKDSS